MAEVLYGVRRAAPFNTVMEAPCRDEAADLLLPGDVIVVSADGGRTWRPEESEGERLLADPCDECKEENNG